MSKTIERRELVAAFAVLPGKLTSPSRASKHLPAKFFVICTPQNHSAGPRDDVTAVILKPVVQKL
jgi:hypothetical protein